MGPAAPGAADGKTDDEWPPQAVRESVNPTSEAIARDDFRMCLLTEKNGTAQQERAPSGTSFALGEPHSRRAWAPDSTGVPPSLRRVDYLGYGSVPKKLAEAARKPGKSAS